MKLSITFITLHFFLIPLFFHPSICSSQVQFNCNSETVREAQKSYDQGNIDSVFSILKPCLENLEVEDRRNAFELIALSYLFNGDLAKADSIFLKLLQIDPEYSPDLKIDSVSINNLYSSFRTHPIYYIRLGGGTNVTFTQELNKYDISPNQLRSSQVLGYQFFAGLDINLSSKDIFQFGVELSYNENRFKQVREFQTSTVFESFSKLDLIERQNWLRGSILLKINPMDRRAPFAYYLYGGGSIDYLMRAELTNLGREIDQNFGFANIITTTNESLSLLNSSFQNRAENIFNVFLGTGFKYKLGLDYLTFDLRFSYSLNNLNNPETRYSNPTQYQTFGYISNDFKLHRLYASLGYSITVFKPKKKQTN